MSNNFDFELMVELLRGHNKRFNDIESSIVNLTHEVRSGFASMRSHINAQHLESEQMERRIADLELAVERLNHAQGINAEDT